MRPHPACLQKHPSLAAGRHYGHSRTPAPTRGQGPEVACSVGMSESGVHGAGGCLGLSRVLLFPSLALRHGEEPTATLGLRPSTPGVPPHTEASEITALKSGPQS